LSAEDETFNRHVFETPSTSTFVSTWFIDVGHLKSNTLPSRDACGALQTLSFMGSVCDNPIARGDITVRWSQGEMDGDRDRRGRKIKTSTKIEISTQQNA
jgi:hypothetical protein